MPGFWEIKGFVFLAVISMYKGDASCLKELKETQVARMCRNSKASGTTVYIDTSASKATDNATGPLCMCKITFHNAKLFNLTVSGPDSVCGSVLNFNNITNEMYSTNANCKELLKTKQQVAQSPSMNMTLEKKHAPYNTDYCTTINLELCGKDEYQCDVTGKCMSDVKCNGLPECPHGDDEKTCPEELVCTEGKKACKDKSACYTDSKNCDRESQCKDGSDKLGCDNAVTNSTNPTESPETITTPLIQVECYESTRFSTTTTTTTPTTTTTTTPTTTTATTTTTTTPTTTTTITPTTTSSTTANTTTELTESTSTTSSPSKSENAATDALLTGIHDSAEVEAVSTVAPSTIAASDNLTKTHLPKENAAPLMKNPYAIGGIVLLVVLVTAATIFAIVLSRRYKNKKRSENLSNDLWISNKDEKELEPMNKES